MKTTNVKLIIPSTVRGVNDSTRNDLSFWNGKLRFDEAIVHQAVADTARVQSRWRDTVVRGGSAFYPDGVGLNRDIVMDMTSSAVRNSSGRLRDFIHTNDLYQIVSNFGLRMLIAETSLRTVRLIDLNGSGFIGRAENFSKSLSPDVAKNFVVNRGRGRFSNDGLVTRAKFPGLDREKFMPHAVAFSMVDYIFVRLSRVLRGVNTEFIDSVGRAAGAVDDIRLQKAIGLFALMATVYMDFNASARASWSAGTIAKIFGDTYFHFGETNDNMTNKVARNVATVSRNLYSHFHK